ncbi:MAG: HEPN domain-containing protein [Nitrospira sp.]
MIWQSWSRCFSGTGKRFPPSIAEAARLTRFAVETRYPSLAEAVTREDYNRAVAIAAEVIRWVEKHMLDKR